jgi:predicted phage terminase large subunit-like protein
MRKRAIELARRFNASALLIEDAASGAQLIQMLRHEEPSGVPTPIRIKPDSDKETRLAAQSARIEAGDLFLPIEADWLPEFKRELLGFPNSRYADQVDALAQLLGWTGRNRFEGISIAAPMIFYGGEWHDTH